jgi:hypothetical protein
MREMDEITTITERERHAFGFPAFGGDADPDPDFVCRLTARLINSNPSF